MITKRQALELVTKHVSNPNIIKHMLALEVVMKALARYFKDNEDGWGMAGLLHDGDYCDQVSVKKQGLQIVSWAKEAGFEIPNEVAHAIAAHNWGNTGVEPETKMDWAIFCADSLTGLIVACALILPSKKLRDVTPEFVMRKFKQPSFASGTRREDIKKCETELGIPLDGFVQITLSAMQSISQEIGL